MQKTLRITTTDTKREIDKIDNEAVTVQPVSEKKCGEEWKHDP